MEHVAHVGGEKAMERRGDAPCDEGREPGGERREEGGDRPEQEPHEVGDRQQQPEEHGEARALEVIADDDP